MVSFDSEYAQISWDEKLKCVVAIWKKFAIDEDYQIPMEEGLKLFQQKNTSKWLADTRKFGVVSKSDQEWIDQNWIPKFAQTGGTKYVATVLPENVLGRLALDAMITKATVQNASIIVKNCGTIEEAKTWLSSQD